MKNIRYCVLALCLAASVFLKAQTATFNYTGSVQTFVVPPCVTSITVDVIGGKGGDQTGTQGTSIGGKGGRVQGTISVNPGDVLTIYVGGQGGIPTQNVGGFNGGGNGGQLQYCAGGGGASDIRLNGSALSNRIFVAGGGGGAGTNCWGNGDHGGAGGGLTGADGCQCSSCTGGAPNYPGAGGTQSAGGAMGNDQSQGCVTPGSLGIGGTGACTYGGGGGGGYYGGGGAGYGGGGGGSSYTDPSATNVVHTQGYQTGDGLVIISYGTGVTFAPLAQDTLCINAAPFTLTGGSPPGGTYSGPGVSSGTFNPSTAGAGTWTITYTYSDTNCTGTATQQITVNACVFVEENTFNTMVNIYPNPANETINIYVSTGVNDLNILIMDIQGKVIYAEKSKDVSKGGILRIDASEYPAGVYLVKLSSGAQVFTKKITLNK